MKKYELVTSFSFEEFEKKVNELAEVGYVISTTQPNMAPKQPINWVMMEKDTDAS